MNDLERSLAYKPTRSELAYVRRLPARKLPRFSVIIPSLNQGRYLPETIESIRAQEYPRADILVVDGGSTDGTVDVLRKYRKQSGGKLKFISEKDRGQYEAVNKGIDATDGEIVAWINSDDVYLPGAFWKVATFFTFNHCAMVVYGRNWYTDPDLNPRFEYPTDWSPVLSEQRRRMLHFCLPPQPSLFFRRAAPMLAGLLSSEILDYELWLRWQRAFQFFFLDDFLSMSRLHAGAKTMTNRKKLILEIVDVVHRYYLTVPRSWAIALSYERRHGTAWTTGASAPIDARLKLESMLWWGYLNLAKGPRAVASILRGGTQLLAESMLGKK